MCTNHTLKSFYTHFFADSSWKTMPRNVKIPHKFFDEAFQVKVRGEGVYYYLYDRHDTEITTVAFSLLSKGLYLNHCLEG